MPYTKTMEHNALISFRNQMTSLPYTIELFSGARRYCLSQQSQATIVANHHVTFRKLIHVWEFALYLSDICSILPRSAD